MLNRSIRTILPRYRYRYDNNYILKLISAIGLAPKINLFSIDNFQVDNFHAILQFNCYN